ncbi:TIR domain-containing adapter molecule 1-like [Sinocyclocheilus anshuiensis]|uniref:TIR domain-containing adapter molecule 1-like n=1 Tax=Sinocyclocheilus anshuiensis TaxID=1608454 RepID=UPI0007B9AC6A|nr:PREDICTED: TIR domain-containing adapter molecule 1-like [Sinocyclocheilus anshuiensis]XP_016362911.1 PREDICTED: TIR domain-containing adapter molecule 1-like [Sinocyclocheilus anshuiensis]
MADGGVELMDQGFANLAKAFEILSQAGQERWVSLTLKMDRRRAEELVNAMCLILLKRIGEAHAKLTANSDSSIGKYLAEMVKMHGERVNSSHIGGFKSTDINTLLDIARVFAVLVQERLCDKSLRDQAYREALASSRMAGLLSLDVEEEVKQVCGPDIINESNTERPTETYNLTSLERNESPPSSQQSSSRYSLEISLATATESNMEQSKPMSLRTPTDSETTTSQDQLRHRLNKSANICAKNQLPTADVNGSTKSKQCLDHNGSSQLVTSKNTNLDFSSTPNDGDKLRAQPLNATDHKPTTQPDSFRSPEPSQSDVEETFYDFVILHEAEDADEAQRLRDKLESIIRGVGATFSDEFAQPGKSTLRCMEDAIENSAFTLLLLTQNFNSNLSVTSADSAIVNSLENHHKMNSVIPLLPRKNCLSRKSFPLVLQTKVPLDESSRMFERNAQKAIAREKVAIQKTVWMTKQRRKKLVEEQKRLQEENAIKAELRREEEKLARLRLESEIQQNNMFCVASAPMHPPPAHGPMHSQHGALQQQQPSCIHIENAQNVMIGNHSTMNIDHAKNSADEFDF